jgi:uncharacterized protein (TIGR04255 family)
MERREYKSPPVEEAICDFQFAPGQEWDFALQIQLLDRFRPEYTGKVRRQQLTQTTLTVVPDQDESTFTFKQGPSRLQYTNTDATRIVAVGKDGLSVHVLRPYEQWEQFRARIRWALDVYREVVRPSGIRRISLRYINRIVLPVAGLDLDIYFSRAPKITAPDMQFRNVLTRTEAAYPDEQGTLVATFASLPDLPGRAAFMLDNDVIREWREDSPLLLDEAIAQADNLKERSTYAFESMITDKTREVFDADIV